MKSVVRNIIFDFGNVIVDLDRQGTIDAFVSLGADVQSFLANYDAENSIYQLEVGSITPDEFYQKLFPQQSPELVRKAWCKMLVGIPLRRLQALEFLSRRYNLYLLSNTNDIHWSYSLNEHFLKQGYDPQTLFKKVFLSHEMHLAKPDTAIYQRVLDEAHLQPEETVFIDDSADNCAAFASLGVQTFQPLQPDAWLGDFCPAIATIGFFDGVHRGHQCLINQLKSKCPTDFRTMVITMNRHPRQVVQPDFAPQLLTTTSQKLQLLYQCGADHVEILDFDWAMSQMTAPEFMQKILRGRLGVRTLVMGYDHRFGHGGGSHADYVRWGEDLGIQVILANELDGDHVSSSEIRLFLQQGDVERAAELLGRPYTISGSVVPGRQVGRKIGFPTANLKVDPSVLLPAGGVYAVWAVLPDGGRYKGMLNIGRRPTLNNGLDVSVEVNLMAFSGDLYETSLSLQLVCRLRDEQRFESIDDLQRQLRADASRVESLLS